MILRAIILAVITLIITAYIEIKNFKRKGFDFFKALIGIAIALTFLSYPLFSNYTGFTRIACTILFAIQAVTLNEDFELLNTIYTEDTIFIVYRVLSYILYFIAPLLGATALLSLFGNVFSKLKFKISTKKQYHIFSEINEKTLAMANNIIKNNKDAKVIFTNKENSNEQLINKKILKLTGKINELNLSKINKQKYLYFMGNDEDNNLKESLEFIDKYNTKDNVKLYILNDKPEAYIIIDSVMSQHPEKAKNIEIELVNETERMVLQRLKDLPIQKIFKSNSNEVTVLIVGCGSFGQAFLKAIIWCFQVIGYKLKIIVIEKNAQEVINRINLEAPELLEKYQIEFITSSIETVISQNLLKEIPIDYAIVSSGTDTNNFNIAIALRRYFLVNNQDDVIIDICIRDNYKSKSIGILKDDSKKDYNFNTFGTIEDGYFTNPIIHSDIEKMAKNLHNLWQSGKQDGTYNYEYNRKSSRATAVHIKYKLYSILRDKYTGDIKTDMANYKELIKDEKIVRELAKNEHNRWMAYMYTDGYRVASKEALEKYYLKIGKSHKNTLAKLHPALVENEKLLIAENEVDDVIEKLTGVRGNCKFTKLDDEIVQRLDEII